MGSDVSVGFAGASGHLELNVFKPAIIHNVLESAQLLADACHTFTDNCIVGMKANRESSRSTSRTRGCSSRP
jgi:fumarate hydratase class II